MLNLTESIINTCVERLQAGYRNTYGNLKPDYADEVGRVASMALKNIANSNALYHNVEHTILVTLVGQEILRGKHIRYGSVSCEDWLHFIISLLFHDIGYVKGACLQDKPNERLYDKGIDAELIFLPPGSTDASLTPYHVDRGKVFFEEFFSAHYLIDIEVVKQNIEMTRFPVPDDEEHQDTVNYPGLVRAADLIGQLSDPRYLEKMPALFYEFEETGVNTNLGYSNPDDLRAGYPKFFRSVVYPLIEKGLHHLKVTKEGKEIIANLYKNVSVVEQEIMDKTSHLPASGSDIAHPQKSGVNRIEQRVDWDKPNQLLSRKLDNVQIFELNIPPLIFMGSEAEVGYISHD